MRAARNTSAASAASHSDAAINSSAPLEAPAEIAHSRSLHGLPRRPDLLGELAQGHAQLPGIHHHAGFLDYVVIQPVAVGARQHEFLIQAAFPERLGVGRAEFHGLDAALGGIAAQRFAGLLIQLAPGFLERLGQRVQFVHRRQMRDCAPAN